MNYFCCFLAGKIFYSYSRKLVKKAIVISIILTMTKKLKQVENYYLSTSIITAQ